jgi:hypothetical protein
MSTNPRPDAKLKRLPPERQAAIWELASLPGVSQAQTLKWLRDDGVETSAGALSEFLSWYSLRQQLQQNESTVKTLLEDLKRNDPGLSAAQLESAGQMFFSALAIEQKDSLTWKRIQDTKLKLGVLQLSQEKFRVQTCELFLKWFADKKAAAIASSNLSQSDKIEKLGQAMFGEDW